MNAVENLNSVAAIVVGFTLASAAELLGFLLLVAADHPATAAMIKQPATNSTTPETLVGVGLTLVALASISAVYAFTPGSPGKGLRSLAAVSEEEFEATRARIHKILDGQYARLEKKRPECG